MKISDYQLRQLLSGLCGDKTLLDTRLHPEFEDLMQAYFSAASLPCDPSELFLIEERIPVFADFRTKRSLLLKILSDRNGETGLVADTLIPGKEGLFLASLLPSLEAAQSWLSGMNPHQIEMNMRTIDDSILAIAPLRSFVPNYGS